MSFHLKVSEHLSLGYFKNKFRADERCKLLSCNKLSYRCVLITGAIVVVLIKVGF